MFISSLLIVAAPANAQQNSAPGWSYDNDYTGQEEWGLISGQYAACGIGTMQSPIHIAYTEVEKLPDLAFSYSKTNANIANIERTVQITFNDDSQTVQEDGKQYILKRIEFHSPGEHIIKNRIYAMEVHLMHENADGDKLIVAMMGEMEKPLEHIDALLDALPETAHAKKPIELDPRWFLPVYKGYYAYMGSLTYPPCIEGIKWRIMKSPIDISKEQLRKLSRYTKRNARLTQPVYTRKIMESDDPW
ncbi:MAG: carbonic anhydrase family protein [Alphaproteobacteria bacterium]